MRISSQEVEYMIDPLARYIACALEKFASVSDYKDISALMALKDNKTSGFSTDFPLPCRLVYSRRRFLHWACVKASPKKYIQYSYINHARIFQKSLSLFVKEILSQLVTEVYQCFQPSVSICYASQTSLYNFPNFFPAIQSYCGCPTYIQTKNLKHHIHCKLA